MQQDQVYSPELEAQNCPGGQQEHESCVQTLGYCPYDQAATFYPGEPVRRHDLETFSPSA